MDWKINLRGRDESKYEQERLAERRFSEKFYLCRPFDLQSKTTLNSLTQLRKFLRREENQNGAWIIQCVNENGVAEPERLVRWVPEVSLWLDEGCVRRSTF